MIKIMLLIIALIICIGFVYALIVSLLGAITARHIRPIGDDNLTARERQTKFLERKKATIVYGPGGKVLARWNGERWIYADRRAD